MKTYWTKLLEEVNNPLVHRKKINNVYKVNVEVINAESDKLSEFRMVNILLILEINNVYEMKVIGRQKLCLYFNNLNLANDFNRLDLTNYNIKTSIPLHYLTTTGIVKNIPPEMNVSKLVELTEDN
jgi:hypothetical protein